MALHEAHIIVLWNSYRKMNKMPCGDTIVKGWDTLNSLIMESGLHTCWQIQMSHCEAQSLLIGRDCLNTEATCLFWPKGSRWVNKLTRDWPIFKQMWCSFCSKVVLRKKESITWYRSVGSIEACLLYGAISEKVNRQEVSTGQKVSRDGESTKSSNQREVHVVTIINLVEIHKI